MNVQPGVFYDLSALACTKFTICGATRVVRYVLLSSYPLPSLELEELNAIISQYLQELAMRRRSIRAHAPEPINITVPLTKLIQNAAWMGRLLGIDILYK
jgi:hypothetical protein